MRVALVVMVLLITAPAQAKPELCVLPRGFAAVIARIMPEPPRPRPLSDEDALRIVRGRMPDMMACYQLALRNGSTTSAKASVDIEIAPSGRVTASRVDAPAFVGTGLAACIDARLRATPFPPFVGSAKRLSYPVLFVDSRR
jgi:hypothetical protein